MAPRRKRPAWARCTTAREALTTWALPPATLRLVDFGENTTWCVASGGNRYALRIYRPGRWTDEQILVEHELMGFLGSSFKVGPPLAGCDDETLHVVPGTTFRAALFPWSPGRLYLRRPNQRRLGQLGEFLGELHHHLVSLDKPTVRSWGEAELIDAPLAVISTTWSSTFPRKPFPDFLVRMAERWRQAWRDLAPETALLHADLHLGNIKWSSRGIHPIDFDDCGVAPLVYDLAVPACQAYCGPSPEAQLVALVAGYGRTAPRPIPIEELRLFMAIRRLWELGWAAERPEIYRPEAYRRSLTWIADWLWHFEVE